jgi:hypothetical protein
MAHLCHDFGMSDTAEAMNGRVAVLERRSRPVTVFLDASLLEAFRAVAAQNERSMSGELRHLIRRYVECPEAFSD